MQIQLGNDGRELKSHGDFSFPLLVSPEKLSAYETGSFACHWHPELEFTLVLQGEILYQVNDQCYHLKKGDGIFCNSNMLHTGSPVGKKDCDYLSITIAPSLLYGYHASLLQTKYVLPIIDNPQLPSVAFHPFVGWQADILTHMEHIWQLYQTPSDSYELELLIHLYQIWLLMFQNQTPSESITKRDVQDLERLRKILTYIHNHYMEHITLDHIAACVNLCKSECCRLFKRNMHRSVVDYLIFYRIQQSLALLGQTGESITSVALKCGFSSPSYYTKTFQKYMGCTPREFRERSKK